MKRLVIFVSALLALPGSLALSQESVLAEIRNIRSYDLQYDAFTLDAPQDISLHAIAANDRYSNVGTNAWILNADTREIVWKLNQARQRSRGRWLADYDATVNLPRGNYEVYFATYAESGENIENFGDFVDYIADRLFNGSRRREYRDMSLSVRGSGRHAAPDDMEKWHEQIKSNALISLSGLWDDRYERRGFSLEKPAAVTVYALGEGRDGDLFDYGWIINTKTGERVWEMVERDTRHAGGAAKNRMIRETISLPAGQYAAFFITDDSHSYRDWNAAPPHDPSFWGLTIWLNDNTLKKYTKSFDYTSPVEKNVLVALTELSDLESVTKSFTLKRPMDVRIYAIGEGTEHDMSDYGWITDAVNHRRMWTMEYDDTRHAGGDRKNRMIDKVLHLDKGTYSVTFVTDDSHSYRHWNSSPPFDQEHWGITLSGIGESYNPKDVVPVEEPRDPSALASIVRVGNDERRRSEFSLSHKTDLHIYALGEADGHDMADYAWIENASSGKVMWEMRYGKTDHAGGARKNRRFDGTVTLPEGNYLLFFETDGSHAYGDWNDTPPDDPESWGVTITVEREGRR